MYSILRQPRQSENTVATVEIAPRVHVTIAYAIEKSTAMSYRVNITMYEKNSLPADQSSSLPEIYVW